MNPSRKALLAFVEQVARLNHESDGATGEDSLATVNDLILQARSLLGRVSKCDDCGSEVLHITSCPDGAEICQACFDAGRH